MASSDKFFFEIPKGDSADLKITCLDNDGEAVALSGLTLTFRLKSALSGTTFLTKASTDGKVEIAVGDETNVATVHIAVGDLSVANVTYYAALEATTTGLESTWIGSVKVIDHA